MNSLIPVFNASFYNCLSSYPDTIKIFYFSFSLSIYLDVSIPFKPGISISINIAEYP